MKLGSLLHLVGLNRNSYNTLNRRNSFRFMDRDLLDERSYDRYSMTHAVAVGCVVEFMAAGLSGQRAGAAVDNLFRVIDAATHTLAQGSAGDHWWLTITNFADGSWGWASGNENADTFGRGLVSNKVSINVVAVWEDMAKRLGTPMDPSNVES
ncbi:hypothetical protein PQ455_00775 [Sphingomonas naphthae]|uniref:Uncharacterized protein n=1 Tax=Sphingomonas naphthae TaxID=1813468 RepID=A0ABY7TNJ9_9SPHN|nr:hypothetical protein [Sphingomonas naphthae]WCT73799.1 hypothetical protein PQ455_00775 [Sphingomonas naphthae]